MFICLLWKESKKKQAKTKLQSEYMNPLIQAVVKQASNHYQEKKGAKSSVHSKTAITKQSVPIKATDEISEI